MTKTECRLYMALASRRNSKTSDCFPKIETLAEDIDESRQSASTGLKGLVRKGLVGRFRRCRGNGSDTSNNFILYPINLDGTTESPYSETNQATKNRKSLAQSPEQTASQSEGAPPESAVPPIEAPTAPPTSPASPKSKTGKGTKSNAAPKPPMTDPEKELACKDMLHLVIYLAHGVKYLNTPVALLPTLPHSSTSWFKESKNPITLDANLSRSALAGYAAFKINDAKTTAGEKPVLYAIPKMIGRINNLIDDKMMTTPEVVQYINTMTKNWARIKAELWCAGNMDLDDASLVHSQVIKACKNIDKNLPIDPASKSQAGAVSSSLPGIDLTPIQSDMACRDLAHMHIYLLWGPAAVIPEVMNLATHREMMSAALARGLKPGATMLYNPINAATSAGWTDPQWASYYWTIISALRADRGKALTPPDWRKLMSNIKTLRSKYGSRLWNFLETFDDNYDEIMPDDKNFVIALNESTLNHGTIAAKLEQMVDDQPADAGSSADWSNHPGNAYLAAVSAPSLAHLQATEAAKHNPPPAPPAPHPWPPAPVVAPTVKPAKQRQTQVPPSPTAPPSATMIEAPVNAPVQPAAPPDTEAPADFNEDQSVEDDDNYPGPSADEWDCPEQSEEECVVYA